MRLRRPTRLMSASIGLLLLVLTQTAATAAIAARDEDIDSDIDSDFDSDSDSDSDPTQTQSSATHTIKVGPREDPHQYVPKETDASIGDTILFEFYPRNHSVVQADFLVPCIPRAGGFFDSGNFNEFDEKNGQLVGEPPTWSMVIRTEEPLFFYCTAIDSCIDSGMVGVINPNSTQTWASQYKKALEYPYQLSPGESPPAEGEDKYDNGGNDSDDDNSSSITLSGGAIAGIVVGVVAAIAILGVLFFVLGRNRVYRKWLTSEDGTNSRTARWALTGGGASTTTGAGGGGPGGGPGGGAWSTAGDTMRQTDITSTHPGRLSYMTSDMAPHTGHLSMQQTPGSPPANWSWDARGSAVAAGAAMDGGPGSPKPVMPYHDHMVPHELSAIQVAELDAGPNSPKEEQQQQGFTDGAGTGTGTGTGTENNR